MDAILLAAWLLSKVVAVCPWGMALNSSSECDCFTGWRPSPTYDQCCCPNSNYTTGSGCACASGSTWNNQTCFGPVPTDCPWGTVGTSSSTCVCRAGWWAASAGQCCSPNSHWDKNYGCVCDSGRAWDGTNCTASLAPTRSPTTRSPSRSPITISPTTRSPTLFPTSSPTLSPTRSPTLSPTRSPTTRSPATLSPTPAPNTSPTAQATISPTSSPTLSLSPTPTLLQAPSSTPTSSPTRSPMSLLTTPSPTRSPNSTLPVDLPPTQSATPTGLSPGGMVGIAIAILVLFGMLLYFLWSRKRQSTFDTASKKMKSADPREVALDGKIKLCEKTLQSNKMSAQNKLFLQSLIAGAKDDKHTLSQLGPQEGVEMLDMSGAPNQGALVLNMEDFTHVKFLSQGHGGTAELYEEKTTKKQVVIKVPFDSEEVKAEATVWSSINLHPNVARMIGIVNLNGKIRGIAMEYYPGGSLNSTEHEFSSNELLRIAIDLARGLQCLHESKVIHRDLAARNILMASNRRVAITDFGMSRQVDGTDAAYRMLSDARLPWQHLAPEVLAKKSGERVFTEKTDIWALGVTLWELATKRSAYAEYGEDFKSTTQRIENGAIKLDLVPIVTNHPGLLSALIGCFNWDPTLRPTAKQLRWLLKDEHQSEQADRREYIATFQGEVYNYTNLP